MSLRQWREGYPDELLSGWQTPQITVYVEHKTEMLDAGYGDGEPIIVRASEPMPAAVCFGAAPDAVRRLVDVALQLLALLASDGGVGRG